MSNFEKLDYRNMYYVFDSGSSANHQMFSDIEQMENAKLFSWGYNLPNNLLKKINRIHLSPKLNMKFHLPFQNIWNKYSVINVQDSDDIYWIIVTNFSARRFTHKYLNTLRKQDNVRLVLLYLDPLSTLPDFYRKHLEQIEFDLIYSFDKEDCNKYGWIYTNCLYSMIEIENIIPYENDVYYVGLDKGRSGIVKKIYERLSSHGIKCDFNIISEDGSESNNGNGLRYHKNRICYNDVLNGISRSKAVLEIMQDGQVGMTMRPYEALFYNKLLLTNNSLIKEMPFYNQKYMRVFSKIEDIDYTFFISADEVNYQYKGEFSPIYWIKQLDKDYSSIKIKR